MITKKQRLQWIKENKCHICGSNESHSHPQWQWLANPAPGNSKRAKFENKINKIVLNKIVGI